MSIANPIQLEHPSVDVGQLTSIDIIYWIYVYGNHLIDIFAVHDLETFPIKSSGKLIFHNSNEILPGTQLHQKQLKDPITKLYNHVERSTNTSKYIYQRYKFEYYVSF